MSADRTSRAATTTEAPRDYVSTLDLDAAADLIRRADGPVIILTHAKPDGDAFGSVVALAATLRAIGKTASAWLVPPVPSPFTELRGGSLVQVYHDEPPPELPEAALWVVLDTGAWSQLGAMGEHLKPHLDRTLIIDHHLSGNVPAEHRYIDGTAAACCEIVAELADKLLGGLTCKDAELSRTLCEALFIGIASDTGWFRFSNTSPRTHALAARLLEAGVDHAALYQQLEQTERPQKLALLIRALDSLRLFADGRAAVMILRGSDFAETGALEEETERLIDIPQQVGTIQVIVLLSEKRNGNGPGEPSVTTRMSFRSKPGPNAVNVADLAARFGGGGHARAAGARMDAPVEEVLPKVQQALEQVVAQAAPE